ncbi:MAG: helix-turn-helix transcriptional regulator [Magnetospirillum sp.]|nr:helix-turn-helix transcriptional regulator [Magnetospirillum sp.]
MMTRTKGRRGKTATGAPNPVDIHVGNRVRLRRTLLGLTQERLGDALGLTFQQVQKYERGANRISASRLFDLAGVLDVPVGFFFDDMSDGARDAASAIMAEAATGPLPAAREGDALIKRETLELVRAYYGISDAQVRRTVYDLAKALSASAAES